MRFRIPAFVLAPCIAMATAKSEAQQSPIQQGSIQIGGTADISRTDGGDDSPGLMLVEAFPKFGYFVVKGLAVTLNVRLRRAWAEDQPTVKDQSSSDAGIGPGVSYYVTTRYPRLFPFVSARTLYNRNSSHAELIPSGPVIETTVTSYVWLGSAGALYMLGEHVGLTSEAFYQRQNNNVRNNTARAKSKSSSYGLQWGITAFIF